MDARPLTKAGGDHIRTQITSLSGSPTDCQIQDNADGTYAVEYTPFEKGNLCGCFLSSFKNRKLERGKPAASNAADTFVWQTAEVCQELLGFLSGIFASGGANCAGNTYFNLKK